MNGIRIVFRRNYRGYPYEIEASLEDLKQIKQVGKIARIVECWIDSQRTTKIEGVNG